ncbi:MAG: helix-turn-helix domain-containing protein [Defluviitaleaceae bacterium]|nr:helix-turn-helix domain-containing protein [Defluviitaleaceae bacterium]
MTNYSSNNVSIGVKINAFRKQKGITQEALAEHLGVSAQAVSKWENDNACPDIGLLVPIAKFFGVRTDDLLNNDVQEVMLVPEERRKNIDDMVLRVIINSQQGDKVRLNLPLALIKAAGQMGLEMSQISGGNEAMKSIDFNQIITLIEKGVLGRLVDIESSDGTTVVVMVE